MIFPLGSALSYVLIDAFLALIALLAGFFGAMWYTKHIKQNADSSGNKNAGTSGNVKIESGQTKQNNDAERTSMAAFQSGIPHAITGRRTIQSALNPIYLPHNRFGTATIFVRVLSATGHLGSAKVVRLFRNSRAC